MTPLHGRIALVTGSSRGIGTAIARVFATAGARSLRSRDIEGSVMTALSASLDECPLFTGCRYHVGAFDHRIDWCVSRVE